MSDIVDELRNGTAWWRADRDIRYAAADEIERLRAGGCARNQRTTQFCAEAADANTRANAAEARVVEAERELAERAAPCQIGGCKYGDLQRQLAAAREALRRIIGTLDDPTGGQHVADMRAASAIARAALSDAPAPASAEPAP